MSIVMFHDSQKMIDSYHDNLDTRVILTFKGNGGIISE
jgi:hypothetical protein